MKTIKCARTYCSNTVEVDDTCIKSICKECLKEVDRLLSEMPDTTPKDNQ